MATKPVALDFSTAQPIGTQAQPSQTPKPQSGAGVTLDFSTAVPINDTSIPNDGEQTNDVGNTVIVPKNLGTGDEESFADTMKRAAEHGKTVTQDQIDAEMKTAPKKAATVLAAAPVIGAAGAGSLAGAGEAIMGSPAAYKAIVEMAKAHPTAAKAIAKFLIGGALGDEVGHSAKSAILGGLLSTLLK